MTLTRKLVLLVICGCALFASDCAIAQARADAESDVNNLFVRIQSDLERIAMGRERAELPAGASHDVVEQVVDAYASFLRDDFEHMDLKIGAVIGAVDAARKQREASATQWTQLKSREHGHYLDAVLVKATHDAPLIRLMAAFRLVDTTLLLRDRRAQFVNLASRDEILFERRGLFENWLRLPCRTLIGRVRSIDSLKQEFAQIGGPPVNCPALVEDQAELERMLESPALFVPRMQMPKPDWRSTPEPEPNHAVQWNRAAARAFMIEDPDRAEIVLREAAREDAAGKLDYALFLLTRRSQSADRDAAIGALIEGIPAALEEPYLQQYAATAYRRLHRKDADRESALAGSVYEAIMLVGEAGGYEMPCALLLADPHWVSVMEPIHGGGRDNFLPKTDCGPSHPSTRRFPFDALDVYRAETTLADGGFLKNFAGSARATHAAGIQMRITWMLVGRGPEPLQGWWQPAFDSFDHPYQTWALLSADNYSRAESLRRKYEVLKRSLTRYNLKRGLAHGDAEREARLGLFSIVYGADCGGARPEPSVRQLLLEGASVRRIRRFAAEHGVGDAPQVVVCSEKAGGLDPLPLIAAARGAKYLELIDEIGIDIDERNGFGKSALMAAAQSNRIDSVRWLLSRGAAVDATTSSASMVHDRRHVLLYAAAKASAGLIDTLLDAGADIALTDSNGRRAVDYLLGFGPTPANPVVSERDRRELAERMF